MLKQKPQKVENRKNKNNKQKMVMNTVDLNPTL